MLNSRFYSFLSPLGSQLGGHLGAPNFTFLLETRPKRVSGGLRAAFLRVLKKDLNLEGSWDRFLIDFGTVSGAAGGAKIVFSLQRESNFDIFGYLKLRCLLDPQKHRFWLRFGEQVGHQNRPCWGQEGAERRQKEKKTQHQKRHDF